MKYMHVRDNGSQKSGFFTCSWVWNFRQKGPHVSAPYPIAHVTLAIIECHL
jgi:hypothetical protein